MSRIVLCGIVIALLGAIIIPNYRSLYEGIFFYLRDSITYSSDSPQLIHRDGRYASIYDLVDLRNSERRTFILKRLENLNLSVNEIPIPNSQLTDIFVQFDAQAPFTIFSAHYDKLFDEIDYQGASDNTAAISVLLASIEEIAHRGGGRGAFLFTGEEERGLRGASAFIDYAHEKTHPFAIREIVNFDNVGRGNLAIRPSAAVPGFIFTIPFIGDYGYDGRNLHPSPPYPLTPSGLTQAILRAQPRTTVFERFTALSDSNIFQANGIQTVAISGDNIPYLERTWHTFGDRVELLDERNLDLAFNLVLNFVTTD